VRNATAFNKLTAITLDDSEWAQDILHDNEKL
jgi:hypothetical protein